MKKIYLIPLVLVLGAVIVHQCSRRFKHDALNAYEQMAMDLQTEIKAAQVATDSAYAALHSHLRQDSSYTDLKDSLAAIYQKSDWLSRVIDHHASYLEDSILGRDKETGSFLYKEALKEKKAYWFKEMKGWPGGRAAKLRQRIETLDKQILQMNASLAYQEGLSEYYYPPILKDTLMDGKHVRWEQRMLSGPAVADRAVLASLKLDLHERLKQHIQFIHQVYGKRLEKGISHKP